MYAVIETGGKQYRVNEGQVVRVELLPDDLGSKVSFDTVSLVATDDDVLVGTPHVDGATVKAKVVEIGRSQKVIAFKKKRRKGYRRKVGHRQAYTALQIEEIVAPSAGKKKSAPKKKKAASKAKSEPEDSAGEEE